MNGYGHGFQMSLVTSHIWGIRVRQAVSDCSETEDQRIAAAVLQDWAKQPKPRRGHATAGHADQKEAQLTEAAARKARRRGAAPPAAPAGRWPAVGREMTPWPPAVGPSFRVMGYP